jgi:hypothetical protein
MSDTKGGRPGGKPGFGGKPGGRGPGGGKGRHGDAKPAAPKRLMTEEKVIDRGVRAGEEGDEAWTIVKIQTVDLDGRAPVGNARYEIRVGETKTEAVSLTAAREAVGKVISHPEKVTKARDAAAPKKK